MIKRLNVRRSTRSNLLFALVGLLLTLMIIMPVYILIISSFKPLKEIYIHVLGGLLLRCLRWKTTLLQWKGWNLKSLSLIPC